MRMLQVLLASLAVVLWRLPLRADAQLAVDMELVCASNAFFDTAALHCATCDTYFGQTDVLNMVASSTDLGPSGYALGCECAEGYRLEASSCLRTVSLCAGSKCTACPANQMPTKDKLACLPCDPAAADYIASAKRCICDDSSHVLIDRDAAGNRRLNVTCLPCPSGSRVISGSSPFECQSCPDPNQVIDSSGKCACGTGYVESGGALGDAADVFCTPTTETGLVLSEYPRRSALVLSQLSVTLTSAVQDHYYVWSAVRCFYFRDVADLQPCQVLANLCALQHYNEQSSACTLLEHLQSVRTPTENDAPANDWKHALPWIFYGDSAAEVRLLTDISLTFAYEDDARGGLAAKTEFYLSSYTLEGEWRGMEPLTTQFWCVRGQLTCVRGLAWRRRVTGRGGE
jgi:hypothetical protein